MLVEVDLEAVMTTKSLRNSLLALSNKVFFNKNGSGDCIKKKKKITVADLWIESIGFQKP